MKRDAKIAIIEKLDLILNDLKLNEKEKQKIACYFYYSYIKKNKNKN